MTYTNTFPISFTPNAQTDALILGPQVRFSLLTDRLFRLEYSPSSSFEDRPSQVFWNRQQPVPEYCLRREGDSIEIETNHLLLHYQISKVGFSSDSLSIKLKDSDVIWEYGQKDLLNLKGTTRTLDERDGAIALEDGLISRSGWTLWDDSHQLLFTRDGWLTPREREEGYRDLYFLGYEQDYYACLRDFCKVAGEVPMLPRWAFGNWWSRYWAYTSDELLSLMDEFKDRQIPLSVCIVDMDWHIVDTGNESSGWTGYTWNRTLFPDPSSFISALHERGLVTALNLHPAEGIHDHEEQYETIAQLMGIDPKSSTPIPFAIGDPKFTRAYFEQLHHPYEEQGVDFWWLDWQQGTISNLPGLDPLWWLNHLHFYDLGRGGRKLPFIFSRWGGLGNHRYPIGFSGDTHVTWESLKFQPYFTATAANVNYGWWSHDIGGHMGGVEDPELYVRWVQFGVLSPILRLHSTNNPYHERRPWGYDAETERISSEALRFRHALIPYLQTMAWQNHTKSIPLIRPMYYDHPQDEQAYHCPDQYLFGSELIAAPYSTPVDYSTRLSRQVIWFPKGDWFNFFNGDILSGDAWHAIYGAVEDIPLFARAGAVVPLAPYSNMNGDGSRVSLEIHLFPGADGAFDLFDGDGLSNKWLTQISHFWCEKEWLVQIEPTQGEGDQKLEIRTVQIFFRGIHDSAALRAKMDGQPLIVDSSYDYSTRSLKTSPISLSADSSLNLVLVAGETSLLALDDGQLRIGHKMVSKFRLNSYTKLKLASQLSHIQENPTLLAAFQMFMTAEQLRALAEIVTWSGAHRIRDYANSVEEILLWNNRRSEDVRMIFVAEDSYGQVETIHEPLPSFAVLSVGQDRLTYRSGAKTTHVPEDIQGWIATVMDRIPPYLVKEQDAVIQFEIGGVADQSRYLLISQGELSLQEGFHDQPTVTIRAESIDWMELISGDRSATEMFLAGKLGISGDKELLNSLIDVIQLSLPGEFKNSKWRLDINYFDALTLELGEA